MRTLFRFVRNLIFLVGILAVGAGTYIGNVAYEELMNSPWDQILGIKNQTNRLDAIHKAEKANGWTPVEVTSADGTVLSGTYIGQDQPSHRTVILLHGLYSNRSMMMAYVSLYKEMGYNVLLIDLRGHGESGGPHTNWGLSETDDLDRWVDWLREKDPSARIGMHGLSLGAAMALLYSGTGRGQDMLFYVADSSYANLMELGREKLLAASGDSRLLIGMDVLHPFFQGAMYFHSGKWLSDIEPSEAVRHAQSPILFLHGGNDKLVPPETAEELAAACRSSRKEVYIFQGAGHAMEFAVNPRAYTQIVQDFVKKTEV